MRSLFVLSPRGSSGVLRWLGLGLALATAMLTLGVGSARDRAHAQVSAAGRISVYDFNINKMDRDWQGWINHIQTTNKPVPELLLIQDMQAPERALFQEELGRAFGSTYYGRAVGNSTPDSGVLERAIIWRGSRFTFLDARERFGYGGPPNACEFNANNAGIIQVRLRDDLATTTMKTFRVTAATFKTAPNQADACAWENVKYVNGLLKETNWSGDLLIFGGDMNAPDRWPDGSWKCWYAGTQAGVGSGCGTDSSNRNYGDPIYQRCAGVKLCLEPEWTSVDQAGARIRIDFIFAKLGTGGAAQSSDQETMLRGSVANGGNECKPSDDPITPCFSDHRGLRALIHY